jgi:2-dehydro-3-deoxygluconokinase
MPIERAPARQSDPGTAHYFGATLTRIDRKVFHTNGERLRDKDKSMKYGLNILQDGALDFISLGALVHRLDPGIIPFRKATECRIHVSGGEFNCAANLADCFGMKTGIATAMVDYPIGELIAERVRAMGVKPFYKRFKHNGVNGPNLATVYSDRGHGVRAPVVFYNRPTSAA